MAKKQPQPRVLFRDAKGRYVSASHRYTKAVVVEAIRRGHSFDLVDTSLTGGKITPQVLAQVLTKTEFESLDEALSPFKTFTTKKKYAAWDICEQVDKTKGARRKTLKYTMEVMDGKRMKKVSFYHIIKRNGKSSYGLFRRMNQELGLEGMYTYDKVGSKILADRKGKKITLKRVVVEVVV